ncbi:predicted protein [Paecilomyces variotii No. 5]|uniref:Prion-inhibition and propagation HeLo domain-containing protein n=1 Tax=Byssochlamys spectabilis (strain No. 5 / NBRC 109023) TaxID=1356009 RepID=V5FHR0_BYSSN|nr:predicted protein [Paecilomyces variotii No. 5]
MADVAGLVLGVVALWQTCVEVFETVDSGRKYGMDYELLRVKLEVERIRLHSWGDTVGLGDNNNSTRRPDPRLERDDVANTVMRVLGCIHHLFENSERLQNTYGLQPSSVDAKTLFTTTVGQPILGTVFKKAYEGLKRDVLERQKTTQIARKTMWAIKDKQKFQTMITEIKGFNDNLESLFRGSRARIAKVMREDVESSVNMEELRLLQDATAEDHEDISDCASARLETIGAASTVRTELLTVQENPPEQDEDRDDAEDTENADGEQVVRVGGREMSELEKQMNSIDLYFGKKRQGVLSLSVLGPWDYTAKVTTQSIGEAKKKIAGGLRETKAS